MGKIIESDEIKLALSDTLEKLLTMDIGNQMELALWVRHDFLYFLQVSSLFQPRT